MISWQVDATFVQTVVTTIGVGITAWIASRGLNTWRSQMIGAVDLEVSRQLLRSLYRVREELGALRSRAIWTGEEEAGRQFATQRSETVNNEEAIWIYRWQRVVPALADLSAAGLEAEVLWGKDIKPKLVKLNRLVWHFRVDLGIFVELSRSTMRDDEYVRLNKVVMGPTDPNEKDVFGESLEEVIRDIEDLVRPHIRPQNRKKKQSSN